MGVDGMDADERLDGRLWLKLISSTELKFSRAA
jgi:hypothetical protein